MAFSIRNIWIKSYFGRLFRADKPVFCIVFLFFACSLFFNLIKLEMTPFFLWSMYSSKIAEKETYKLYEVRFNDNKRVNILHTWLEPERTMLMEPLIHYINMKDHQFVDPMDSYLNSYWVNKHPAFSGIVPRLYNSRKELDQFPAWYKKYLSRQTNTAVKNICVLAQKVQFRKDGLMRLISTDTVLIIP